MDAFESIVAKLLWEGGYWTTVGYKVNLSKEQKVQLGKHSMPRPEIDIVAYRARDNHLLWVECKSYLDSTGVRITALTGEDEVNSPHYKVFTWPAYRELVTSVLIKKWRGKPEFARILLLVTVLLRVKSQRIKIGKPCTIFLMKMAGCSLMSIGSKSAQNNQLIKVTKTMSLSLLRSCFRG